ncbi:hypothetical protein POVWA2_008130 [Plasmodium ovale wallikeri]|uniref:Uncharacterized protein n=1 Tax=Plasmodium ovale wallikeri TaxID=864142 RepID=A0A1A8YJC7_PLAOA|nr:hypothetical protein POVWA1_008130 [Plasmodium ovale wallikeri]SBT32170.1 hypothetical protein POVWA2_008130 [Plasmodium ovale wallikeri]
MEVVSGKSRYGGRFFIFAPTILASNFAAPFAVLLPSDFLFYFLRRGGVPLEVRKTVPQGHKKLGGRGSVPVFFSRERMTQAQILKRTTCCLALQGKSSLLLSPLFTA